MGSAASSLSPTQSAELTRLLKIEYDKYQGKSDEEIRVLMIPQYNKFLAQVLQTLPTTGGLAGPSGTSTKRTPAKGKGPTRRRSFGQQPTAKGGSDKLKASESSPAIDAAAAAAEVAKAEENKSESISYICSIYFHW